MKIGIIIALVLAVAGGGYLFYQNQSLEKQIADLKDEKAGVEIELAVLKNTDLAKENEILKSKLDSREKELSSEKKKVQGLESDLGVAKDKIQSLESKISKAKLNFAVLSAFNDWEYKSNGRHILDRDTSKIDSAIAALGDSQISNLWTSVKANFPRAKETGDFRYGEVTSTIHSRIDSLLK